MMRNVAIGAVLGFGLVVLFLSIFNAQPPPPAPAPGTAPPSAPAAAAADGSANDGGPAATLVPVNIAPVITTPNLRMNSNERRLMIRDLLREQRPAVNPAGDGGGQ
jgi:hypothetical protein